MRERGERETAREKEGGREGARERERERARESVCVYEREATDWSVFVLW